MGIAIILMTEENFFCHRIVDKRVLLSLVYHSKIHKEKMKGYISRKEAKVSSIFDV